MGLCLLIKGKWRSIMSSERTWHSSLLCHHGSMCLCCCMWKTHDAVSFSYSRWHPPSSLPFFSQIQSKSIVSLSLGNIADIYLISSVLQVLVGSIFTHNWVGLFSWDALPAIFHSITFPFPNASEEIFKQVGIGIKEYLQRKTKAQTLD